jgi:sulfate adenylyltransferase (ADP) / ATP adenylyltransferase
MGSYQPPITLTPNLYQQSLAQFDALALSGKLLHGPYTTTLHPSSADTTTITTTFLTAFQLAPHLNNKPCLPANAPERKTNNIKSNPFANPDPDFLVGGGSDHDTFPPSSSSSSSGPLGAVGPDHVLMLNKFCVYRPSLLLVTKEYAPQSGRLEGRDLRAAWAVLRHLEREAGAGELVVIYNCGAASGSSQGHKHLQILPRPRVGDREDGDNGEGEGRGQVFELFPGRVVGEMRRRGRDVEGGVGAEGVRHKHFVMPLDGDVGADAEEVVRAHETLYARMREFVAGWGRCEGDHEGLSDELPHNVVMTRDWICLIPRRHSGSEKGTPANALGMVGVVWTTREGEADRWVRESGSVAEHLAYLGYPID